MGTEYHCFSLKDCSVGLKYLPFVPNNASEAGAFELTFLFAVVSGLEAIVCLLVVADTVVGRTCVEAAPRLTVLTEV